jgi:hypothetical protein
MQFLLRTNILAARQSQLKGDVHPKGGGFALAMTKKGCSVAALIAMTDAVIASRPAATHTAGVGR